MISKKKIEKKIPDELKWLNINNDTKIQFDVQIKYVFS